MVKLPVARTRLCGILPELLYDNSENISWNSLQQLLLAYTDMIELRAFF